MFTVASRPKTAQSGMVLPVALIALVAATLLSVGFVRSNIMSLRIGGASVVAEETQGVAEALLANFFALNPLTATADTMPRYQLTTPTCSTDAAVLTGANKSTVFDCRINANFPSSMVAAQPAVQRTACGDGPRSAAPSQAGTPFNYYQITTNVTNDAFGSRAQVGAGVAQVVVVCP